MSETSEATFASDADLFGSTEFSVTTDKADYAPGETAIITASGVDVGGSLTFEVDHISDPGPDGIYGTSDDITTDLGGSGHESWTIVDGGEGDLDGIANGVIVTEWYVDPDDSLNETFLLTASDGADTAYASFTDGASYNLDQWRNGSDTAHVPDDGDEWVNGNLNENQAHYYQGDFVAYRATLSDLTQGSYFITMEYDVTQGGEYSIDYLGSYDASFGPGETHDGDLIPDPVDGTALDGTVDSLLEVALSPLIDAGPDGIQGTADDISPEVGSIAMFDGQLTGFAFAGADGTVGTADDVYYLSGNGIWGDGDEAMVTGISDYLSGSYTLTDTITSEEVGDAVYTLSGDVTGNAQQSVTLIFDYTGTNGGDAVLAWGGHIATNEDWDDMANPSGSPYHMRLLDMKAFEDDGSTIQVTGAGNQDRSLSRSAIVLDNPDFEVTKTADVASVDAAGDVITYTITITNTGDVALTGVSVSDPLLGALSGPSGDTNLDGALDVDEVWTYSGSYSVLQADLDSNGTAEPDDNDDNDGDPLTVEDPDGDIDNLVTVSVAEIEEAKTARADVDIVQDPSIDVVKTNAGVVDIDGNGDDAGDEIVYSYAVTNDGNVTLFDVSAIDDLLGAITLTSGLTDEDGDGAADDLAVGATANGTATETLDQSQVDAGSVTNVVTASGTDPNGDPVKADDANTVPIGQNPAIDLDKTGAFQDDNGNGRADVGETITYQFTATNIGNVTLTDVTVSDPLIGAVTPVAGDADLDGDVDVLGVGESAQFTGSYAITQADIDAGLVENLAEVCGIAPDESEVCDDDPHDEDLPQDPSIDVMKTNAGVDDLDGNGDDAGDEIVYSYAVTNDGNVTLFDVSAIDDLLGAITLTSGLTDEDGDGAADDLAVGATANGTATETLDQSQVDAGSVTNVVTASGTDPNGDPVKADDANTVPIGQNPAIDLDKTGAFQDDNGNGRADVGETITYQFTATNIGNVTLTDVTVSDPLIGAVTPVAGDADLDGDVDVLGVGESAQFTGSYAITQADIDAGLVENLAEVCAIAPDESEVCDDDPHDEDLPQDPSIDVVKTNAGVDDLDGNGDDAGDEIVYSYAVTNDGNVTLFDVSATDDLLGAITLTSGLTDEDGDGAADDLAVGATANGTATETLDQIQVDAGSVTNVVTASGTDPNGDPVKADDANTVPIGQNPAIDLDKTGAFQDDNDNGRADVGETITYQFTATNIGNVTLTDVTVSDPLIGAVTPVAGDADLDGDVDVLGVGESAQFTGSYAITQADIDAGLVENLAEVCAIAPDESEVCDDDPHDEDLPQDPSIDVVKTNAGVDDLDGNGDDAGDEIVYSYAVTNDGNVTLFDVSAIDDLLGAITLTSGLTDEDGDGAADDLAVGATANGTATETLDQIQVDAGSVTNVVTASGTDPNGDPVKADDANTVPIGQNPAIDLDKTGAFQDDNDNGRADVGETITYQFTATNIGNVTLTDVTVSDPLIGAVTPVAGDADLDGDVDVLGVGESAQFTGSYAITQADIDAGLVENLAEVCAIAPDESEVCDDDPHDEDLPQDPSIDVVKTNAGVDDLDGNGDDAGDEIVYSYAVTNDGNVTLFDVSAIDDLLGAITLTSGLTDEDGDGAADDLAVGATANGTATETLDQTQVDAGSVTNVVTASGTDPNGDHVKADDANTVPIGQNPAIDLDKTGAFQDDNGNGRADVGETITYQFTATNIGNVTLTDVTVSDPLIGAVTPVAGDADLDGDVDVLGVGESAQFTGSYAITQADIDAGLVENLAEVCAIAPDESEVCDDDPHDEDLPQDPSIDVVKTNAGVVDVDGNGHDVGDLIYYNYDVTNDGNVTLFDVSAVDDKLGNILLISGLTDEDGDGFADDLAVGATANGTALQVLTQDIVDAGTLTNIVLANGTDPMGGPVGDDDTNTVSIDRSPAIQVVKSNGGVVDLDANGDDAGDKVDYSYIVSNIGNVTLFDVTADDDLLGAILLTTGLTDEDGDGVADDLAVGASAEGTATEILDQAQVDNGIVVNVVTAEGTGANGQDVSDQDSNEVPVIRDPSISISKVTTHEGTEGDDLSGVVAGDFVGWKYYVSNTGNVTLTDPSIVDDHGPLDPDFGTGDGGIVEVMSGGWNVGDSDMNGVFDVGEQWVYVSAFELEVPDNLISYTNEATATAETTVDPQQVSDSDTSGFALLPPGMVTNSALCDFGEVFQVNFSPDKDGTFTQNSTNPGQYFYNTIFDYDQEFTNGDGTDNVLTMKIPDGFVLQSGDPNFENAVHVYDSVSVEFDAEGNICLIPGAEISRDLYTVSFQYNPDGTMEAIVNFGDSDLTGLTYVNIHLDYETKGSDGWEPKDGVDAVNGNPPDGYELDGIQDGWSYDFDAMLTDGADTSDTDFGDSVMNDNVFKPFKQSGFGGYVWSDDTGTEDAIYETGEGIEGALVMIFDSDGNEIDSATTDEDGWWYSGFTHKGKQASYTVELHADGTDDGAGTEDATAIATLGKGDKFDAVHFYEDDLDQFQSLEVA